MHCLLPTSGNQLIEVKHDIMSCMFDIKIKTWIYPPPDPWVTRQGMSPSPASPVCVGASWRTEQAGEERHLQNTVRTGHSHESLSCEPALVIYSSNANINGLIIVRLGFLELWGPSKGRNLFNLRWPLQLTTKQFFRSQKKSGRRGLLFHHRIF